MLRNRMLISATIACTGFIVAAPKLAFADDFYTFYPRDNHSYCADGVEYTSSHASQHIAVAGPVANLPYVMECTEDGPGNAAILHYDGYSLVSAAGGKAEYISAAPSGNAWIATVEGNLWWGNAGGWWPRSGPAGRQVANVAAVNDSIVYVLALPISGDSCDGGAYCVWETFDGGGSWGMVWTDWDGTLGANALAYDLKAGKAWIADGSGHVLSYEYDSYRDMTYWWDRGTTGLPAGGAVALAVWSGVPWVIVNGDGTTVGGPVFSQDTPAGTWNLRGSVTHATDIALDYGSGAAWIVEWNPTDWWGQRGTMNVAKWGPLPH